MKPQTALQKQDDEPASFWKRFRTEIVGLARDFWSNPETPPSLKPSASNAKGKASFKTALAEADAGQGAQGNITGDGEKVFWHADAIQIAQKLWGEGYVSPGGDQAYDRLFSSLSPGKSPTVLDLSAELGQGARFLAKRFDAVVTGLEQNAFLAKRGTMLSLATGKARVASVGPYDPEAFTASKTFDFVIARMLFNRVLGKEKFFKAIVSSLEKDGTLVFTDFLLGSEDHEKAEIAAWLALHPAVSPLSREEMEAAWAAQGLSLSRSEDLTDLMRREIVAGLSRFTLFLSDSKPDRVTKLLVLKEIQRWAAFAAALKAGLQLRRFVYVR